MKWLTFTCSTGFHFLRDRSTRSYFWNTGSPECQENRPTTGSICTFEAQLSSNSPSCLFGKLLYFNRNLKEDTQKSKRAFSVPGNSGCQGLPSFMQYYHLPCSGLPANRLPDKWARSKDSTQNSQVGAKPDPGLVMPNDGEWFTASKVILGLQNFMRLKVTP